SAPLRPRATTAATDDLDRARPALERHRRAQLPRVREARDPPRLEVRRRGRPAPGLRAGLPAAVRELLPRGARPTRALDGQLGQDLPTVNDERLARDVAG